MIRSAAGAYLFRLGRAAYFRTTLKGVLLFGGFVLCAAVCLVLGMRLFASYNHAFTPYLKWQDMLVALLWFMTFISLCGCILTARFLYTLWIGRHKEMLVVNDTALVVRDLSHENLNSIFWLEGSVLACFMTAEISLIPEMLIGWTLHIPQIVLAVLATGLAILLSLAALAITLIAVSFIFIGLVGSISFCRNLGAPHTYWLTSQAALSIDNFVLTILYPDTPEAMIDLNMLDAEDQRHLLWILRERWTGAEQPWNPQLGEEIEAALKEAAQAVAIA